jgi:hypothetical protein
MDADVEEADGCAGRRLERGECCFGRLWRDAAEGQADCAEARAAVEHGTKVGDFFLEGHATVLEIAELSRRRRRPR